MTPEERKYRLELFEIWKKVKRAEALKGTERMLGKLMLEHKEYYEIWQNGDVLPEKVYGPDHPGNHSLLSSTSLPLPVGQSGMIVRRR